MVSFSLLVMFAYALTTLAYLLGRATKEEHNEIKNFAAIAKLLLIVSSYFIAFFFLKFSLWSLLLAALALLYALSFRLPLLQDLHHILLYGVLMLRFAPERFELIIPLLLALLIDKSFKPFSLKEELYNLSALLLFLLITSFFFHS